MACFRADLCLYSPESYTLEEERDESRIVRHATGGEWALENADEKATVKRYPIVVVVDAAGKIE